MKEYKIKEGNYSSGLHFGIHLGKTSQRFKVKFDSSCLYKQIDWENDWNKLIGWSYGDHRKNSIRVGWRQHDDTIHSQDTVEIGIYLHENGIITTPYKNVLVLSIDYEYTGEISYDYNTKLVTLMIDGLPNTLKWSYTAKPCIGYNLYPYFGGSNPAPHDMKIELERL